MPGPGAKERYPLGLLVKWSGLCDERKRDVISITTCVEVVHTRVELASKLFLNRMSAPRWYSILGETLSEDKNPSELQNLLYKLSMYLQCAAHLYHPAAYSLATLLSNSSGTFPRSRSVIHRGIVSPSSSRPLLLTTTDIRTPKAHQLHANPNSEATFWFAGPKVQFRIVASTYLLPQSSHPWHASFPAYELTGSENSQFNWDHERLEAFDGISGHLRASFVRPVPGTPTASYEEAKKWPETAAKRGEAKEEEEKRVVEEALTNFALVVLDAAEVEFLELGPIPNRRTKWTKKGNQWEEQIVVP
jgi:pyridoxamine 5'-phosphate oxidase